jgi:hypothetical protein
MRSTNAESNFGVPPSSNFRKTVAYKTSQIGTATFLHVKIVVPNNLLHQRTCSVSIVSVSIFLLLFVLETIPSISWGVLSFNNQSIRPHLQVRTTNPSDTSYVMVFFIVGFTGGLVPSSVGAFVVIIVVDTGFIVRAVGAVGALVGLGALVSSGAFVLDPPPIVFKYRDPSLGALVLPPFPEGLLLEPGPLLDLGPLLELGPLLDLGPLLELGPLVEEELGPFVALGALVSGALLLPVSSLRVIAALPSTMLATRRERRAAFVTADDATASAEARTSAATAAPTDRVATAATVRTRNLVKDEIMAFKSRRRDDAAFVCVLRGIEPNWGCSKSEIVRRCSSGKQWFHQPAIRGRGIVPTSFTNMGWRGIVVPTDRQERRGWETNGRRWVVVRRGRKGSHDGPADGYKYL